ncbi:MAG: EAL domain-containing protein [Cyanobacteria bacterium J06638_28]
MPDSVWSDVNKNPPTAFPLQLLIVEDVEPDIELIVLALEAANLTFEYEVADTLEQCRQLLMTQHYSVVLADYRLPSLQAPQVYQLVSELQPHTPFILVTGSLGEEAAVGCIKAGMTDYVLKDSLYRLPTVLKRALDEAELKRQRQVAIAQLEQQAWHESILSRIVQAMRETLILEDILQTTVSQLQAAMQVDYCTVIQPSAEPEMLVQYISRTCPTGVQRLHQPSRLCAHFDQELRSGQQIVLVYDAGNLSSEVTQLLQDQQLASTLITPLSHQQDYFGAISLHYTHRCHRWTQAETSLMSAIADQCAIAIYQAQLYEKAQREIQKRQQIEDQLRHDAFHDDLTGLPNRTLFLDRLNHALQIAHRHHEHDNNLAFRKFAVLFLDLDDFRIVNDSLGHNAGDFLLSVVAHRLNRCLRPGDTLARTSGDEFAILLEDIAGIDDITDVVEGLQNTLKLPINIESQEIFASACIGIVMNTPNYSDAAQFLRDADTAMYQAKEQGRGHYQVFDGSMHTQVKQRLRIENDLRRALNRNEFSLAYQPIIHLPTRRICGFEVLIRWCDPVQGILLPDHFIPVAEQTGLINPIGQWVLYRACTQWKRWLERWPQPMRDCNISINLSAKQFAQQTLIREIEEILKVTGVDGHYLRLEVTESALMDNETAALETLQQLKSRSIQVIMDDFGTGYSSLSYLLRFPKDALKIDKSFVSNLDGSADNQEIIKTIISLGSNLGLDIVGEGIETEYQAQFLLQHGCLFGQGYWFSRPLNSYDAEQLLFEQFKGRHEEAEK